MASVEEVGCVTWVELHGFETFVGCEGRGRPFPETAGISLTTETGRIARDRGGMPGFEADIATFEVEEEVSWGFGWAGEVIASNGQGTVGGWSLLYTVV